MEWSVSGIGIEKTTYITIDDLYSIDVGPTKSTTTQSYTITKPNEFNLTHGTHKIAMRAGTKLAGKVDEEDFTDYTYHNLIFHLLLWHIPLNPQLLLLQFQPLLQSIHPHRHSFPAKGQYKILHISQGHIPSHYPT